MRTPVILSAAISLLLVSLPSPSSQRSIDRVRRRADPPPWARGNGPPPHAQGRGRGAVAGGDVPPGWSKGKKNGWNKGGGGGGNGGGGGSGGGGGGGTGCGGSGGGCGGGSGGGCGGGSGGGCSGGSSGGSSGGCGGGSGGGSHGGCGGSRGTSGGTGCGGCGCSDTEFRCTNGDCVPASARCDEKYDCEDLSDEAVCSRLEEHVDGCILPERPEGGDYELGGCGVPCGMRPGDKVPRNSILSYACRPGYVLHGSTVAVCVNDEWHNVPKCLKPCHPLASRSVDLICTYQGNVTPCDKDVIPGTRATLSCKRSYKLPLTDDPGYREITCQEDGSWDRRIFRCLPECGTAIARGNTLVVNGFDAELGVFPWHVGIYNKKRDGSYEQICAGTLLNSNLVLSAAHCFFDETVSKLRKPSNFAVAGGKHYRDWDSSENYAQKSEVEDVMLPDRYIGARGNFAQDIALVKLKTPFELTALVRPICMDWDNVYERQQLQAGQSGKAVGWGKTIDGTSSEVLQEVNMPFIPYDQCLSAIPIDFRGYITSDKFCAGHLNGSSLCEGDSGGGLCFQLNGVWYIRGIVSVSPAKGGSCDYNSYVGFTYVSYFRDWIRATYVTS